MKLRYINIKKAKPGDKARKLFYDGGLFFMLKHGKDCWKLWRFKYRFDGKEKLLSLP